MNWTRNCAIISSAERKRASQVASALRKHAARRCSSWAESSSARRNAATCGGVRWLEEFFQDIRYGFRLLRKNPGFSAVVILALALGLGANTALFSLFNTVLLGALPVQHPEQLVVLSTVNENSDSITSFSYPMYRELRDKNTVFSGMIAQAGAEMNASYAGESEKARGELVTRELF